MFQKLFRTALTELVHRFPLPTFVQRHRGPKDDALGLDAATGLLYLAQALGRFEAQFRTHANQGDFAGHEPLMMATRALSDVFRRVVVEQFDPEVSRTAALRLRSLKEVELPAPIHPEYYRELGDLASRLIKRGQDHKEQVGPFEQFEDIRITEYRIASGEFVAFGQELQMMLRNADGEHERAKAVQRGDTPTEPAPVQA